MVLAQDLKDDSGRLLVAEGTSLSEALISRLEQTGAALVYVQGDGGRETEEALDDKVYGKEFEQIEARIDSKFRRFAGNEVMIHISKCAKRFLKLKIKKEIK